jgi:flagellar biosynthesis protein FlhB
MAGFDGDKTEQPTAKRLEQAYNHGQFARSPEVQTVCVFVAVLLAFTFSGREMWNQLVSALLAVLGHLHDIVLTINSLQRLAIQGTMLLVGCVATVVLSSMIGGLLAGTVQNRFRTSPEAMEPNWGRLNPANGFRRVFSTRASVSAALSFAKLALIIVLCYSTVKEILNDPIFCTAVSAARIAEFMAESSFAIILRVVLALGVIAAADYGYQIWQTNQDLMMTKQEVKDETRNAEGNPEVKSMIKTVRRRLRLRQSKRKALAEVPKADVVVTNPTHFAVALRYNSKTMKAPKVVAKGARLNALLIREIARQHQVPIVENKPLARMLFKFGREGGEIPAQLYVAVAEVLAWVYRVNRYRYHTENNRA